MNAATASPVPSTRPLSLMLDELRYALPPAGSLTVGTLVDALRERGIGALMVLLALLLALPSGIMPGLNTLFGLPLAVLAGQQALGRHAAWLPEKMMAKQLDPEKTAAMIAAILPWLLKLEKILRPRMVGMTEGTAARLSGCIALIMALFASIPVPLTHTVPGIGLLLMAAGTTQRDGLAVIIGMAIGMGHIILLVGALIIFGPHAIDMIHHLLRPVP